jgi:hypothetical protein
MFLIDVLIQDPRIDIFVNGLVRLVDEGLGEIGAGMIVEEDNN